MSIDEIRNKILRVVTYDELQTLIASETRRMLEDARCEFMSTVYAVLSEDSTNNRANEIINCFDTLL
jgi:hypothetical protein